MWMVADGARLYICELRTSSTLQKKHIVITEQEFKRLL
ncbi:hypothetical protein EDO6_04213 [Paenibacillus xylanexedens]|nr:hypothetical protein EDO6_04213 [Paenibacillus xylanexedens]